MGCVIGSMFMVRLCIGTVEYFINLLVDSLVEAGFVVCITSTHILRLVKFYFPSKPLGSSMGAITPYHWWNLRLRSAVRHNCTIKSLNIILS